MKPKSIVWDFFGEKLPNDKQKCNFCKEEICNSAARLKSHVLTACKRPSQEAIDAIRKEDKYKKFKIGVSLIN